MEEDKECNDSGLDKYTAERVENGINDLLEEKELKIKWKKELDENIAAQEHLKAFNQSSADSFITSYLMSKYLWHKHGDFYAKQFERKRTRWISEAHEHLRVILQKPLFDKQCLWRAEQITIKEIEICSDFEVWGYDIINCPFLELTLYDVELYIAFIQNSTSEHSTDSHFNWQDYDEFKSDDEDTNEWPDWYDFHNIRTGNNSLLLLPDIRGEKERFYEALSREEEREENAKKPPSQTPEYIPMPYISTYDKAQLEFFVTTFDDRETRKQYFNFKNGGGGANWDSIHYQELVDSMIEEEEIIPITAHADFREALQNAYNLFCNKKIAEHLPLAFEQYQFNKKMGLSLASYEDEKDREHYSKIGRNYEAKRILRGRVLNGEPGNFDF